MSELATEQRKLAMDFDVPGGHILEALARGMDNVGGRDDGQEACKEAAHAFEPPSEGEGLPPELLAEGLVTQVASPVALVHHATIIVTQADILNGLPGNCWYDPIVFAFKRAVPRSRRVRVSTVDIAFTIDPPPENEGGKSVRYIVPTPDAVALWIERFDRKEVVNPMAFTLTWQETFEDGGLPADPVAVPLAAGMTS